MTPGLPSAQTCVIAGILFTAHMFPAALAQFSTSSSRSTSIPIPSTSDLRTLESPLVALSNTFPTDEYGIAHWSISTDWVRNWVALSPFSVEYQESASYTSDYKIGSRSRKEQKPRTEEELKRYYRGVYPDLRDDQIDRIAHLNAQVDAKIKAWGEVIRDANIPDKVALEFAAAGDDARMAQLLEEVALGKANVAEADLLIPQFEGIAKNNIEGIESHP